MGNSPAGEVARTLLALLVLRYGQLTGGGRSAHFTCFTGTKVQILTKFLQVSWVLRGVPHDVAFANDVASFEKARSQLLAGQVHSDY